MKKLLLIAIYFLLPMIVVGNPLNNASEDIQGISSSQDIGGVTTIRYSCSEQDCIEGGTGGRKHTHIGFQNHNGIKVTVLYKIVYVYDGKTQYQEGTVVLNAGAQEEHYYRFYDDVVDIVSIETITRPVQY